MTGSVARADRYLYYRLYEWYVRKFGEADAPEFTALGMVFIFSLQNLVTIPIALSASI